MSEEIKELIIRNAFLERDNERLQTANECLIREIDLLKEIIESLTKKKEAINE